MPKQEGGLGLKKIEQWNKAAVMRHIGNSFTQVGTIQVVQVNDANTKMEFEEKQD